MKLYDRSELVIAIRKQLAHIGKSQGAALFCSAVWAPKHALDVTSEAAAVPTAGPLSYTDLLPFDQHHYYGTDAIDQVVAEASRKGGCLCRRLPS
jgi:hypothetical protein